MSAVVLCDGAPTSIKALEFAGYPGFLMRQHEGEQLVVVHMWDVHDQQLDEGTARATGAAAGATSAVPGTVATAAVASPSVVGAASPVITAAASVRMAVYGTTPELLQNHPYRIQRLPASYVMNAVVTAVKGSRFLKDTLNYKLEMELYAPPKLKEEMDENSGKILGGKKGTTKGNRAVGSSQKNASKAAASDGLAAPTSAAAVASTGVTTAPIGEPYPAINGDDDATDPLILHKAESIVHYAEDRLEHHHAKALLLGPGNVQEGKTVSVGLVAKCALRLLKTRYTLYYIKPDGFIMRPTTALVRYVVVIPITNDYDVDAQCTATATTTSFAVPTMCNSALAESNVTTRATSAQPLSLTASGAASTLSGSPVIKDDDPTTGDAVLDALEAGKIAVRYSQDRCRPMKATVSVVLVQEPSVTDEVVRRYQETFNEMLNSGEDAAEDGASVHVSEANPIGMDDMTVVNSIGKEADGTPHTDDDPSATVTVKAEGGNEAIGVGADGVPELAEPNSVFWPPVSVFALKSTKMNAQPTIANSTAQITKHLQKRKCEFFVIAHNTQPSLQMALLSMSKPHVIVVPCKC